MTPRDELPAPEQPLVRPALPRPAVVIRFALLVVLLPALLFISAGTLDWPMAWLYTLLILAMTAISRGLLARLQPDLIVERAQSFNGGGAKAWDRKLMPLAAIYGPLATLIVAGLNRRFHWPPVVSPVTEWVGFLALLLALAFCTWAMLSNRFFSSVVRIQTERGHSVVDSGPYSLIRHPGYAGSVLDSMATPLLLGSQWALIPALITVTFIIARTVLEDRTLRRELPGYAEYAKRVRYLLMPGLW